jgi:putative acetyltransferase
MAIPTEATPTDRARAVEIRLELPADRAFVARLLREAFAGEDEARLVTRLAAEGDLAFSLVAEDPDGRIVGHIAFPALRAARGDRTIAAAALAPVAVALGRQRQGIGARLIEAGMAECRRLGFELVVVVGDPAYYTRFGFSAEVARRLAAPYSGEALMALEFSPGALDGDGWRVTYPRAFAELA